MRASLEPERPTAGARYENVSRLLVVRDDRLGDLLLTLPAVAALRVAYPAARLGLLVDPALISLARLVDGVDDVLGSGPGLGATTATVRCYAPDLAVCVSRRAGAALALWRARVERRVGSGRRWFSWTFHRRVGGSRRGSPRHEVDHARRFARVAGAAPVPTRFGLRLPAAALAAADRWLHAHGGASRPLVLHPGSGGSCPAWPAAHWGALAARLRAAGEPVVLTEGPRDAAALALARRAAPEVPVFRGELVELAALLSRASGVLSNSTGPVHLAAALGRPTLALHAPWSGCAPHRWAPYDRRGFALVADGAAAGWSRRRRRARGAAWMSRLRVEDVQSALSELRAAGGGWTSPGAGVH